MKIFTLLFDGLGGILHINHLHEIHTCPSMETLVHQYNTDRDKGGRVRCRIYSSRMVRTIYEKNQFYKSLNVVCQKFRDIIFFYKTGLLVMPKMFLNTRMLSECPESGQSRFRSQLVHAEMIAAGQTYIPEKRILWSDVALEPLNTSKVASFRLDGT